MKFILSKTFANKLSWLCTSFLNYKELLSLTLGLGLFLAFMAAVRLAANWPATDPPVAEEPTTTTELDAPAPLRTVRLAVADGAFDPPLHAAAFMSAELLGTDCTLP